ncbi:HtaA domain-containing protein [Streptomyces sp. BI20]|uniref:HtaA domain-containing protein n=1 Tax=Streptomyces sp. BI20 TaxID=3403460 RepID=UPI003C72CD91
MSARPARVLTVAALATLLGALLPTTAAEAAESTVRGGRLDWGIKSSFQSYVTGPIAKGQFKLRDGAATAGGSMFRFHSANGRYDPDSGTFEAAFGGAVQFVGHAKPDGTNELDLTMSRPTVRISGGKGTLLLDVAGTEKGSTKIVDRKAVPFATLDLGSVNMRGAASPLGLTGVPATLTTEGAAAFAGYYTAGTRLDPVSLSADLVAAATGAGASANASASPSAGAGSAAPSPSGSAAAGPFADGAVDWGVRRTFREYVTGSVGQGKWTLADGAKDGGALFRFGAGTGEWDGAKGTLDGKFAGSVHFTGAHLDLRLSAVTVKVAEAKGTLTADVTTAGNTAKAVPLVEFDAKDLKADGGLARVTEAPATLTEDGARAFDNMYKAGTEMDPVSLAVAVTPGTALPALPDLGSTGTPAAPAPSAPVASETPVAAEPAGDSSSTGLYVGIGAAVLILAAAAGALVIRRRRTEPTPAAATTGTPGDATDGTTGGTTDKPAA